MFCVIDAEILYATAFIGSAYKSLALVVLNPMQEGFAFLIELIGVEVIALKLAVEAELCLEVRLAYATPGIGEMLLEVGEHLATRHLQVYMIAGGIKINFSPLKDAFAHLLTQCAKHDIMHRWQHTALTLPRPAIRH